MPMMMEDHLDALGGALPSMDDDLFGDEVLPLAHRPPSKQLQKRVDELRSRGCCRYERISPFQAVPSKLVCPQITILNRL